MVWPLEALVETLLHAFAFVRSSAFRPAIGHVPCSAADDGLTVKYNWYNF
jgi:hypothetical protein